jgi:glycosyltransferase involved in cell wall biosynthesis
MKIAFDSQIFTMQEYGGISRYICRLASLLSSHLEIETKIFAPMHINSYLPSLPSNLVYGHKVPRIPKTGRLISIANQIPLRMAMKKFRPDIVHETYYKDCVVAQNGAKTVVTVYDMIHERFPSAFPEYDRTSELKRIATNRADHVICISENTRNDLLAFFDLPEDKVSVVYLGHDILATILKERDITKSYILYVGQRGSYKNFDGFLRAYANSPLLIKDFNVVCFGGGAFLSSEKQLFDELNLLEGQVLHISGNDTQLAAYYRDAALFVYPSLYEGFGIPPLEAMSFGCPVACSNTSSIPEVVGDAGEYFDPDNIESIRSAMELVLASSEREIDLINKGYERCNHFTWERCAQETLAVYRALI